MWKCKEVLLAACPIAAEVLGPCGRLLTLACLLTTSAGFTASIGPGDFSLDATVIDFDDLAGGSSIYTGEIVTDQYARLGVTFVNPDYTSRANANLAATTGGQSDPNVLFIRQHDGNPYGRPQQIWFSVPATRVGAFFMTSIDSTITLSAFSPTGSLLESLTEESPGARPGPVTGFIGVEQIGDIGHVELYSRSVYPDNPNFNFCIDDLRFEPIPEPTAFTLLGLGSLAFVMARWRR